MLDRVDMRKTSRPHSHRRWSTAVSRRGLDLTAGGAVYNSTGVQLMGFANVVDSLYAVKKTVFDEKRFAIGDLAGWLSHGLAGRRGQAGLLARTGSRNMATTIDEVDAMAAKVVDHYCDVLSKYRNFRGGAFWPGIFSVGFHITMGAFTGATPDGRFAGDVLGNGITPTTGNASHRARPR
ncbi:MAG: hypothetical protein MZU91_08635 [Desulfosudis oleivorans]|nr:hypothetical protein [Desulfosudis oleivorans]